MPFPMGKIAQTQGTRPPGAWCLLQDLLQAPQVTECPFQVSWGCFLDLWRPLPYGILLNGPCASRSHILWPVAAERCLMEGGANRAWMYPLSWLHTGMRHVVEQSWVERKSGRPWTSFRALAVAPQMLGEGLTGSRWSLDPRKGRPSH